jgi:hypothetical protein
MAEDSGLKKESFSLKKRIKIVITQSNNGQEDLGSQGNNGGMVISEGSNQMEAVKAHMQQMLLFAQRSGSVNEINSRNDSSNNRVVGGNPTAEVPIIEALTP